ncbi:MAG: hypothetical protein HY010_10180 [Acidobacteria bacterium]|nr:hypothetical protein [Acidobacteriota bacterium]
MSSRLALSDQELLDYSGEHLLYEVQMFQWMTKTLLTKSSEFEALERCALIESFAIHLRNLFEFFYHQSPRDTDVVAADYFDDPASWNGTPSPVLVAARKRADKEVSHLTLQRKDAADLDKNWPIGAYFNEMRSTVQEFIATASPKKLHVRVNEWVNLTYRDRPQLILGIGPVNASTATIDKFLLVLKDVTE